MEPKTKKSKYMEGCIPVPLPDDVLTEVVSNAKDFALLHGNIFCLLVLFPI